MDDLGGVCHYNYCYLHHMLINILHKKVKINACMIASALVNTNIINFVHKINPLSAE